MFQAWKQPITIAIRAFQLLCVGFIASGFIWATSDWMLLYVLVESPVTPLSVLFIMYGLIGTTISEGLARLVGRWNKEDEKK